jgi:hypothetical protein
LVADHAVSRKHGTSLLAKDKLSKGLHKALKKEEKNSPAPRASNNSHRKISTAFSPQYSKPKDFLSLKERVINSSPMNTSNSLQRKMETKGMFLL